MAITLIREAQASDCALLAAVMRPEDMRELEALGLTPKRALYESLAESAVAYTVDVDGWPAAMFGLTPYKLLGERACVWLLTGEGINKIPLTFVKLSRLYIAEFLELYPVLDNWVDARYTASIKWLEMCGAVFDKVGITKPGNVVFRHFYLRKG
jgi:hypothetical protein